MTDMFFREKCPMLHCQRDLVVVRVVGEPISKPDALGVVLLCCYSCHLIFFSEAVRDNVPFVGTVRLRRERKRKINLTEIVEVYCDLYEMAEAMRLYCQHRRDSPTIGERTLHFLASTHTFLTNLQAELGRSIRSIKPHIK